MGITDGTTSSACPAGGCVASGRIDAAATVAALGPLPASSAAPGLAGTANVGRTLTASTGTWTNSPNVYRFDFQRCDADGTSNCVTIGGLLSTGANGTV